MKAILIPAAFAVALSSGAMNPAPASAKGCIKGAVIGGIAGHYAGHHGLLGAGAGCVIGHHEATKHARERAADHNEYGGSSAPYDDRGNAPR